MWRGLKVGVGGRRGEGSHGICKGGGVDSWRCMGEERGESGGGMRPRVGRSWTTMLEFGVNVFFVFWFCRPDTVYPYIIIYRQTGWTSHLTGMWAGSCKCLRRLGNLHVQLYDLQADMLCICLRICFWMQVDLQAVVRLHVFGC